MKISRVRIEKYGKLQDQELIFSKGINIIYGENESGKSTLANFMKSMLFGLEKTRARTRIDEYQKYEPWDIPAYFTGQLEFSVGKQKFLVERGFYSKDRYDRLTNSLDGEVLSIEQGDLAMLLGDISKEIYENTFCIGQMELKPKERLGTLLKDQIHNLTVNQGAFAMSKVYEYLERERKKEKKTIRELMEERERTRLKLEGQISYLREKIASLKSSIEEIPPVVSETVSERRGINRVVWASVAGSLLNGMAYRSFSFPIIVWVLIQVGMIGLLAIGIRSEYRERSVSDNREPDCTPQRQIRLEELREHEILYENIMEEYRQAEKESVKEREITRKLGAIELAKVTLEKEEVHNSGSTEQELSQRIGKIATLLTGKEVCVRLGRAGEPFVEIDREIRKIEAFSTGTQMQLYFAYRMAAGEMIASSEVMPFLLDEPFAFFDDKRLKKTLYWLANQSNQIFLFTCQKREIELLREMEADFAVIRME